MPRPTAMTCQTCRTCRQGSLKPIERVETFHPPGVPPVEVALLAARCSHCGKETDLASQLEENLRRRAARKVHYGLHLLGEEILAFRRYWGLTQQAASRIFGKGIIAFSRYESEKSFPDESTTKLIRAAMRHPQLLKELADESGIEVPLWEERLLRPVAAQSSPIDVQQSAAPRSRAALGPPAPITQGTAVKRPKAPRREAAPAVR